MAHDEPAAITFPELHGDIAVHDSITDTDALWDRFEVFEAIHHSQRICNPMTEAELARLLELSEPASQRSWLDIACGSGELLIRAAELGASGLVGLDLSPWMLNAAARQSHERLEVDARPEWHWTEAAKWSVPHRFDVVTCLGADWIWRGMHSTVAALAERAASGAIVAYGGPRLEFDADPDTVTAEFGKMDTVGDVEDRLAECGLDIIERIDPGERGWLAYLERGRRDVEQWAAEHPGERAERWRADQQEWTDLFERDRGVVGWSVWVTRSRD